VVFVHMNFKQQAIVATPEEAALLRELAPRNLAKEELTSALTARGVEPSRAALLATFRSPRSAAARVGDVTISWFWIGLAIAFGAGKRPLRRWLEAHYPGTEWLVDLIFPGILVLAVLGVYLKRRRRAGDAPEHATRADQIENKPIG
jgi:hypothetical protein